MCPTMEIQIKSIHWRVKLNPSFPSEPPLPPSHLSLSLISPFTFSLFLVKIQSITMQPQSIGIFKGSIRRSGLLIWPLYIWRVLHRLHITGRKVVFLFWCVCMCVLVLVFNVVTWVVFLHLHQSLNPIKSLPCKFEMTLALLYRIFFPLLSTPSSRYFGKSVNFSGTLEEGAQLKSRLSEHTKQSFTNLH